MKVIYIVGDSRNGSTLLQHLLALQEGVMAVGEVRRLHEFAKDDAICACGQTLSRCPFWRGVGSR